MNRLLLIDGHSVLSRAYYGVPLLTASTGLHTNAVFGFLNILFKCIDDEKADSIAVAFDLDRRKLKRTAMYPEYKGTRKPMPAELLEQVPLIREIVLAMNIPVLELEGYEADDLLGTAAKRGQAAGLEVTIVSGDRDLLQLSDEHIKILMPRTGRSKTELTPYYPEDVKAQYQVTPEEFIDLKGLMGDTSDNIPGLPGVGEKTATDIIVRYGSIENAYAHLEELKPPRAQKAFAEHYELAELSKKLATIDINAPLELDLTEITSGSGKGNADGIYTEAALDKIRALELKTLAVRFAKRSSAKAHSANAAEGAEGAAGVRKDFAAGNASEAGAVYAGAASSALASASAASTSAASVGGTGADSAGSRDNTADLKGISDLKAAADTENAAAGSVITGAADARRRKLKSNLDKLKCTEDPFLAQTALKDAAEEKLIGLSVYADAFMGSQRAIIGLAMPEDRLYVISSGEKYPAERLLSEVNVLLSKRTEGSQITAVLGLKDCLKHVTAEKNSFIHDLSIAAYLLEPGRSSYDYDDISSAYLGEALPGRQELIGKSSVPEAYNNTESEQNAAKLAALSALVPYLSDQQLMSSLRESGMLKLYEEIELPLAYTLNAMEQTGIAVDRRALSDYAAELKVQIDALTNDIYELAGEHFNINSPKQLGIILFEKLGISGGKKTKTGYSTAADVLMKLADEHEIVQKILRYRTLTKLYSTYAAGLDAYISEDGRIHGTFNQTVTATGRISSTDPNLQNIPVRTAEGKEIRRVFVPQEGYTFVDADYSQVELRILAALSGDPVLIEAYKNAVDVHTLTASQVFHVDVDKVTPEQRRNAKAVNFGIVYGISAFGLGEGLSISRKEANEYIEQYFRSYPGVKEYLDRQVEDAKEQGFVRTAFGRVRPVPELKSSNFMQRSFGERIAMNSPIQGTAADIMKIAMNRTADALSGMKSRIVLQVHDELLIETALDELDEVKALVRQCMEQAADLSVKLAVEVESGDSWYDCH